MGDVIKKNLWIQFIGCLFMAGGAILAMGNIFDFWGSLGMVAVGMLIALIGQWMENK